MESASSSAVWRQHQSYESITFRRYGSEGIRQRPVIIRIKSGAHPCPGSRDSKVHAECIDPLRCDELRRHGLRIRIVFRNYDNVAVFDFVRVDIHWSESEQLHVILKAPMAFKIDMSPTARVVTNIFSGLTRGVCQLSIG